MTDRLRMTTVGSFPKPDELRRSRTLVARDRLDPKELERLEREATTYWIRAQEEMGLDVLVDGEMYRGDMVTYFSEHMEGFQISGLVRSYGNRYYRKPVAVAPVGRRSSVTVDWWRYSQGLTEKPVKGMVTGPYTMADWSFNEHYSTREEFVMAMAEMVHEEVADLERAGAQYIQIDEPAVSTRPQEMELAAKALGVVTKGITATTITHICYGDFVVVFDQLLRLPVDVLDLEAANSDYQLLELFRTAPDRQEPVAGGHGRAHPPHRDGGGGEGGRAQGAWSCSRRSACTSPPTAASRRARRMRRWPRCR